MDFELSKQSCILTDFNARRELHGEDPQPAADLKFACNVPNDALAQFAPSLRHALYWKAGNGNDLVDAQHECPNLRHPKMGAFAWDDAIIGATVTVSHGIGGPSDLVFGTSNVNAFRIDPQEGGTVLLSFRVQCKPDEHQAGKLYLLQGQTVELTVTPPAADEMDNDSPLNTAGTESEPPARRGGKRGPAAHTTTLDGR